MQTLVWYIQIAYISPFISLNLTMTVFCIGSSEGRTESDDKGLVCYYSIKAYRVFLDLAHPLFKLAGSNCRTIIRIDVANSGTISVYNPLK